MATVDPKTLGSVSTPWEDTELTRTQWRQLEARLSDEERLALHDMRRQWVEAAERLADPTTAATTGAYDRVLAAVVEAEAEFHAFVRALRRVHRL